MDTASVVITALSLILLVTTSVAYAVILSRALSKAYSLLDLIAKRYADQQEHLLDRFQAIRWEDLAALRATIDSEESEEGGFFEPSDEMVNALNEPMSTNGSNVYLTEDDDEDEGIDVIEPGGWGSLSEANKRVRLLEQEQALLDEDFPEEIADEDRRS